MCNVFQFMFNHKMMPVKSDHRANDRYDIILSQLISITIFIIIYHHLYILMYKSSKVFSTIRAFRHSFDDAFTFAVVVSCG